MSGTFANSRTLFGELPSGLLAPKSVTADILADGAVTTRALAAAFQNLVVNPTAAGKQIQMGSAVGETNAGGGLTITFPVAFSSTPVVVCMNGDASTRDDLIIGVTHSLVTATNFEAIVVDDTGVRVGSTTLRFNWVAMT